MDLKKIETSLNPNCIMSGELSKDGCTVPLTNAPKQRLIVDLDKPESPLNKNHTRCDYLFFANGKGAVCWFVPLELKRGSLPAKKIVQQLQAGATVAEQLVADNDPVRFRPIVASGSIHKHQRNILRNKKGDYIQKYPSKIRILSMVHWS
ncbi:MAG: hypothetical protein OXC84_02425 [Gammaproteobacteria bacterium]|nr:hypothetical protein [Gammaproteobacteria bacterium]